MSHIVRILIALVLVVSFTLSTITPTPTAACDGDPGVCHCPNC